MTPGIKLIKKTDLNTVPFDDDRAVTDFEAFRIKAELQIARVQTPEALAVMNTVLDNLKDRLHKRLVRRQQA